MQVIYVDSLFCLSLLTDYLLCLTAGRLCGLVLRRRRYLAAALLGALYSVAVFLPRLVFLSLPAGRLGCGLCMGMLAFGRERQPLRCTGVLLAVAAVFGGALWAVVSLHGREAGFLALEDTGNALSDPLTGRHVLVASPLALRPLLRDSAALFTELPPVELLEALGQIPELAGCFRLLPYSDLSGSGLLPAFRPDRLLLDGEETADLLVAVSPNASGEGFEALL